MTREQDRQTNVGESSPILEARQIRVLQGIVDGWTLDDFRKQGIAHNVLAADKGRIADKFGTTSVVVGISRGILWVIKEGELDESRLPQNISQKNNANLDQLLEYLVREIPKDDFVLKLPIASISFKTFESEICRRLDVPSYYTALAAKAKEMKDRGGL